MTHIRKEVLLAADPARVWDALRDVGALHTRLVPGFVSDTQLDGQGARIVTFGSGQVVRELIVDIDATARRVAWSAVGAPFVHHHASAQVVPEAGGCRFVWIADLLPDTLGPFVAGMMEQGLASIKGTFEGPSA